MQVNCPFVSDLYDTVMEDVLEDREGKFVKSGQWERFLFDKGADGLSLLNGLLQDKEIPTKPAKGYEVFISGVREIAYCRQVAEIRLRCVLAQEECSVYPSTI